jgi:hypothetical protein
VLALLVLLAQRSVLAFVPQTVQITESPAPRLEWRPEGHKFWSWRGHRVHYLQQGRADKPALVLIHGFGASTYHWRANVPALAENYQVYALDLLGFGMRCAMDASPHSHLRLQGRATSPWSTTPLCCGGTRYR